jgi:hypothetical protein
MRAEFGEITADPRAVGASFQGDGGLRELGEELSQRGTVVGQRSLADNLTSSIENANVMLPVTEIQTKGEPADDSRRGSENDGRSNVSFHRQILAPDAPCAECLPSHLIWLGGFVRSSRLIEGINGCGTHYHQVYFG